MSAGCTRALRALARKARRLGFEITPTKSNHARWVAPDGTVEMHGTTPRQATISHVQRWLRRIERNL
jgi:hypothetical protein